MSLCFESFETLARERAFVRSTVLHGRWRPPVLEQTNICTLRFDFVSYDIWICDHLATTQIGGGGQFAFHNRVIARYLPVGGSYVHT